MLERLRRRIEELAGDDRPENRREARAAVEQLLDLLEDGTVRAAEPDGDGWKVNSWVKQGILLGFRVADEASSSVPPVFHFRDRDVYTTRNPVDGGSVRIVPGGTTVRRGSHMEDGVVLMPPSYVNVGAWVGARTMVDSHALVGSCAQVGAGVHLSAAAQVGGVLEPVGARPVIVEDLVFVGGGCGIYEGTRVCQGAVLAAGVILTGSVPVYDLVREEVHRASPGNPLEIPEGAVVVPGARPAAGEYAGKLGLHLQSPVIVKYRDEATDAAAALEDALR